MGGLPGEEKRGPRSREQGTMCTCARTKRSSGHARTGQVAHLGREAQLVDTRRSGQETKDVSSVRWGGPMRIDAGTQVRTNVESEPAPVDGEMSP